MPPPTLNTDNVLINADTGTTGHFIALKDINILTDVQPVTPSEAMKIVMPDGQKLNSTLTGNLIIPHLPIPSRVHAFPSLWGSLLSIGQLCDQGLIAIYDKEYVYIVNLETNDVVLTGIRDPSTKLWMIAIKPITQTQEHMAVHQAQTTSPQIENTSQCSRSTGSSTTKSTTSIFQEHNKRHTC